jgi:hypothetical protein
MLGESFTLSAIYSTVGTIAPALDLPDRLEIISKMERSLPSLNPYDLGSALWAIGQMAPLLPPEECRNRLKTLGPYLVSLTAKAEAGEALARIGNHTGLTLPQALEEALPTLPSRQRQDLLAVLRSLLTSTKSK